MKGYLAILTAVATTTVLAAPAPVSEPSSIVGWTHDKYLEYLTLDTTEGWAGMDNVIYHNATSDGESINFGATSGLEKRAKSREWEAHDANDCHGNTIFRASGFGCGVFVSFNSKASSG